MAKKKRTRKKSKFRKSKINRGKVIVIASVLLICATLVSVAALRTINAMRKSVYYGLEDVGEDVTYPLSELNDSGFFTDEFGFKGYDDDKYTYKRGIDVSEYQLDIDWQAVRDAGVEFAYIRLGYRTAESGSLKKDAYFKQNIEGASECGIQVGVYFFSQATNTDEAIKEAEYVADNLKNYSVDLPVAFDFEEVNGATDRTYWMGRQEITECADAFCTVIENYGYDSIIYINPSQAAFKYNLSQISHRSIWLAHYTSKTGFKYKYRFWQYSESGRVSGIDWPVDLDIMIVEK